MASQHKTAMEQAPGQDAVELLMADHHRVARLFAEFAALKEDGSDEAKSTLVAQICQELVVHTAIEEEIFYPAVRKAIEDDDLMDEALVEHAGAKELIAQLQAAHPDDDLYDAKVTVLGEQIDHHVLEEEGSMFPQARGSGVDTLALGAALVKRKAELLASKAELLASPGTPRVLTAVNDDGDDLQDDRPARKARNSQTSTRSRRHGRPASTKAFKKASKKTR
jgi:hemerythrin superfamily protein